MQLTLLDEETEKMNQSLFGKNVPGVLSSKDNAFGCFIAALAGEDEELVPSGKRWANAGVVFGPQRAIAWRILDAKYFGLAQRRKRVFVIASARDGFCPAQVLFEFDGVRRDTPPSRETGQETAGVVGKGFTPTSFGGYSEGVGTLRASGGDSGGGSETLVAGAADKQTGFRKLTFESYAQDETASTMMARDCKSYADLAVYTLFEPRSADGVPRMTPDQTLCPPPIAFNSRQDPVSGGVFGTLDASSPQAQAVVLGIDEEVNVTENGFGPLLRGGRGGTRQAVATITECHFQVRRLTPIECERLQGFPGGYTAIPRRNKPVSECPDGHRYKALGNSMAVPVMRWIGERIAGTERVSK